MKVRGGREDQHQPIMKQLSMAKETVSLALVRVVSE